jgi:hypothetical protein
MLKEIKYEFILTDFNGEFITDQINGYLEAFIFETSKPLKFDCSLEESEFILWKEVSIRGKHFLIMRYESFKNSETKFNYQYERLPLIDKLKFYFRGQKATKIKLVVRYNDA